MLRHCFYVSSFVTRSLTLWLIFFFLAVRAEAETATVTKIPINKDVWVSSIGHEKYGNNGGVTRWKLKGIQEFTLFDADLSSLKRRRITKALLHLRIASSEAQALRVSISTIATPWNEGNGENYARNTDGATFMSPDSSERKWTYPESTLLDAAWGSGNTIWRFANASPKDADGWQTIALEPAVVAANMTGLSHGFAAMDDVGSEWSIINGKYNEHLYVNRYFYSRHQHNSVPWLEIWTDDADNTPPEPVTKIHASTQDLPAGQALIKWQTPPDKNGKQILGFNVTIERNGKQIDVPRYLIPMAGRVGEEARMLLQDLDLKPGETIKLGVTTVDFAGNTTPPTTLVPVTVSSTPEVYPFKPLPAHITQAAAQNTLPEINGVRFAVIDMLDKIEATTGKMCPPQNPGYLSSNHLWNAATRTIRLQSARNETIAFQVHLEGSAAEVAFDFNFPATLNLKTTAYRFDYVKTGNGIMPDALCPLAGKTSIPYKEDTEAVNKRASYLMEIYVPHAMAAGEISGALKVNIADQTMELPVKLQVYDFTLPNQLSFIPEMNCYGTASPHGDKIAYYRMAHAHRTCLNRLYYNWGCRINEGAAPDIKANGSFDWERFDREFGPLFDGSAFSDLPRGATPVDLFYLPFNENWPMPIRPNYTPNYWADEAFTKEYAEGITKAAAAFTTHFNARGWHQTAFEFFFNNKAFFRRHRTATHILAPWLFDEPANIQDFWALRWYGQLFRQGVDSVGGPAQMCFRADISRSAFSRDMLAGILDIEVMGGGNAQTYRMRRDATLLGVRPTLFMEYGSANEPADANTQPVTWSLHSWANGSIGVLPWQVIGDDTAWHQGSETSLFYPSSNGVVASVRLKAFMRGQQDVEYLTMLSRFEKVPRFAIAAGMRQILNLQGKLKQNDSEDAGIWDSNQILPQDLWALRQQIAEKVAAHKPPFQTSLREFQLPPPASGKPAKPAIGYVSDAPRPPSAGPTLPQGL